MTLYGIFTWTMCGIDYSIVIFFIYIQISSGIFLCVSSDMSVFALWNYFLIRGIFICGDDTRVAAQHSYPSHSPKLYSITNEENLKNESLNKALFISKIPS